MNRIYRILIAATALTMLAALVGACKKDKPAATKSITGGWLKAGTTDGFYIVTADKKWYATSIDNDGFRSVTAYTYDYSGSQLKLQSSTGLKLYNTRYSGDTLILNDGNTDYLTLVPSSTAPTSIAQWVAVPKVLASFSDTAGVSAIAYDAGHIFGIKQYTGSSYYMKLYDFDPAQQRIVHEVVTDNSYQGLDFLNGTLWACAGSKLYKLNPTSGINNYVSPDEPASHYVYGLAAKSDGIYTYNYSGIEIFDPTTLSWISGTRSFTNQVSDMAYANGYLMFTRSGMLYQAHPYYLIPAQAWYLEGYDMKSIAFDGTYYWAGVKSQTTDQYQILKLQLD